MQVFIRESRRQLHAELPTELGSTFSVGSKIRLKTGLWSATLCTCRSPKYCSVAWLNAEISDQNLFSDMSCILYKWANTGSNCQSREIRKQARFRKRSMALQNSLLSIFPLGQTFLASIFYYFSLVNVKFFFANTFVILLYVSVR
jgi:hypothetical protein